MWHHGTKDHVTAGGRERYKNIKFFTDQLYDMLPGLVLLKFSLLNLREVQISSGGSYWRISLFNLLSLRPPSLIFRPSPR